MGSSDIRAGGAFVEVFVKGNVGKELDKVAAKLKAIGTSVIDVGKKTLAFGGAILAPLLLASKGFAEMGDQITKASQRTGVAAEQLQQLKYAAEQSGAEFEDLEAGIRKMQKALFEAASGSPQAIKSLAGLGLSIGELKKLSPDEQFLAIADGISKIRDAGARTAVAMEIFGKGGAKLLPLILEGRTGIKQLTDRARELGLVFSHEDAEAATIFGDTLDDIGKQFKAITFQVGAAVANALQPFANAAIHIITTIINWVKENRNLVVGLLIAGTAFVALGASLIGLGVSIRLAATALSGITSVIAGIGSAITLLLNPIVLIGVGLAALTAYFVYSTEVGQKVLSFLGAKFTALAKVAQEAFGGIADALAAGDIKLAAQILWVALKLLWAEGTHELQQKWIDFKATMTKVAIEAFYGVLDAYQIVKAGLLTAFAETTAFFTEAWQKAVSFTTGILEKFYIEKAQMAERDKINQQIEAEKNRKEGPRQYVLDNLNKQLRDQDGYASQIIDARRAKEAAEAKEREQQLQQRIAEITAQRDKKLSENVDAEQALKQGLKAAQQGELADLEKQRAALQKQLDELRAKAGKERKKTELEDKLALNAKKFQLASGEDVDSLIAKRANVALKSQGIFNVAGIQSLQAGPQRTQEEIKKAAQETAKNTKNLGKLKNATFK